MQIGHYVIAILHSDTDFKISDAIMKNSLFTSPNNMYKRNKPRIDLHFQ